MKQIQVNTLDELSFAAKQLLKECSGKRIFAFTGEMGSGKTTMIKALCLELGVKEKAVSPSFALVNEYRGNQPVYHLDLYRLNTEEEALAIGIEEYLASGNYCFIEWAERIIHLLPNDAVAVQITMNDMQQRTLNIKGC
ncbi:MAG: tRNA (adenosine(37)-N6)-threonylcarbamoyltransferase complex ATPase subunit type 1 TsaE [Chitinophagales bacterium]|nr:tRNA (adenosine(37)-N6)-threonylcarbamoyltransferase complex ATPase subunit type 1 TsaE [Bacteroidota bacterium]MBX7139646.1 tRNA (adenosine(37)-N6)-threonylcarbamoyltransferase complex ATPase subunit type 1 TsaE [Chitinophagales bacterium]